MPLFQAPPRLPVEPLRRALLAAGWNTTGVGAYLDPDLRPLPQRVKGALKRARCRFGGQMSIWLIDDICCHLLGRHPSEVYGLDWDLDVAEVA